MAYQLPFAQAAYLVPNLRMTNYHEWYARLHAACCDRGTTAFMTGPDHFRDQEDGEDEADYEEALLGHDVRRDKLWIAITSTVVDVLDFIALYGYKENTMPYEMLARIKDALGQTAAKVITAGSTNTKPQAPKHTSPPVVKTRAHKPAAPLAKMQNEPNPKFMVPRDDTECHSAGPYTMGQTESRTAKTDAAIFPATKPQVLMNTPSPVTKTQTHKPAAPLAKMQHEPNPDFEGRTAKANAASPPITTPQALPTASPLIDTDEPVEANSATAKFSEISRDTVLLDSGSSYHKFNNPKWFTTLGRLDEPITCRNSDGGYSTQEYGGTIAVKVNGYNGGMVTMTVKDVIYVPDAPVNMLSVGALSRKNVIVDFRDCKVVMRTGVALFDFTFHDDVAVVPSASPANQDATSINMSAVDYEIMQRRLIQTSTAVVEKVTATVEIAKHCLEHLPAQPHRPAAPLAKMQHEPNPEFMMPEDDAEGHNAGSHSPPAHLPSSEDTPVRPPQLQHGASFLGVDDEQHLPVTEDDVAPTPSRARFPAPTSAPLTPPILPEVRKAAPALTITQNPELTRDISVISHEEDLHSEDSPPLDPPRPRAVRRDYKRLDKQSLPGNMLSNIVVKLCHFGMAFNDWQDIDRLTKPLVKIKKFSCIAKMGLGYVTRYVPV